MIGVLLLATFLGSRQLNTDLFWLDEEFSVYMSGGDFYGPISPLEIIDRVKNHAWPPLYNFALVPWGTLVGWSEFSLRVFALLPGVLAVAVVYRLGTRLYSSRVGLLAALLTAASAFYVNYLHEARAYTLFVLFAALSLWSYWRLLRGDRRGTGVLFVLSTAALLYTHYIAAAGCIALGLYHLFFVPKDHHWHRITRLGIGVIVLFIPWSAVAILAAIAESGDSRGLDTLTIISEIAHGFANGLWMYSALMITGAVILLRGRATGFLAFWLVGTLAAALLMNLYADFLFHIRHIILLLPALYILFAAVIDAIGQRSKWLAGLTLSIWLAAGLYNIITPDFINNLKGQFPTIPREFLTETRQILNQCANPDDVVVFYVSRIEDEALNNRLVRYYMHGQPYHYAQIGTLGDLAEMTIGEGDYADKAEWLTRDAEQVWLFALNTLPPTSFVDEFDQAMQASHPVCGRSSSNPVMDVHLYTRDDSLTCPRITEACR